jgi:hypothetical protein
MRRYAHATVEGKHVILINSVLFCCKSRIPVEGVAKYSFQFISVSTLK